jgi:hypothetical protein
MKSTKSKERDSSWTERKEEKQNAGSEKPLPTLTRESNVTEREHHKRAKQSQHVVCM